MESSIDKKFSLKKISTEKTQLKNIVKWFI